MLTNKQIADMFYKAAEAADPYNYQMQQLGNQGSSQMSSAVDQSTMNAARITQSVLRSIGSVYLKISQTEA